MSERPDPINLIAKAALIALVGWCFALVLRMETGSVSPQGKRETVLRKIIDSAKYIRFQSPYTDKQLQQRIKDYTGR